MALKTRSSKARLRCRGTPASPAAATIDLTAELKKKPLLLGHFDSVHLCLVGCGGTGSWVAQDLARFALTLKTMGVEVNLTFVDPDIVETATVFRQNFCFAEVGLNKAETLALRLSAGWGVEVHAQPAPFDRKMAFAHSADLVIVIGCVDNAAARTAIAATLDQRGAWEGVNWRYDPSAGPMRIWWLDLGNSKESGQALLGSTCQPARLKNAFPLPDRCGALPAPSLQHPELLEPRPEELSPEKSGLSCEEMAARNAQSLVINRTVADLGAAYLVKLLFEPPADEALMCYASYVDMRSLSMRSKPILPETLEAFAHARRKRKSRRPVQPVPTP
jgi:PRTRC genetic system ThiF family protein